MLRELAVINPRGKKSHKPKARRNPSGRKKKSHKARRNPRMPAIFGKAKGLLGPALPALAGGAGALGVDYLLANLPFVPDTIKAKIASGLPRTLARVGIALGAGWLAGRFLVSKTTAAQFTAGALTVITYDELKKLLKEKWPELNLGAYEYSGDLSAYQHLSAFNSLPVLQRMRSNGVGAYVSPSELGMVPAVR